MRRFALSSGLLLIGILLIATPRAARATNGDLVIGVGVERALGGAGVAAPLLDAAGGLLLNPANVAGAGETHIDMGTTIFIPTVRATANLGAGATNDKSAPNYFLIPTIGFAVPVTERLGIGLSAYGISGMGVDYRNQNVGNTAAFANQPAPYNRFVGGLDYRTTKQLFQFAPTVAYEIVRDRFWLGVAPLINYGTLDLGSGMQQTIGVGGKIGVRVKVVDWFAVGATYETPSQMKYSRVFDFTGDGVLDNLRLDQPQQVAFGVAIEPFEGMLVVADGKWINWSGAPGYKDFGWRDQYVAAIGGQYEVNEHVTLRLGYNYGANPIRDESGFASGTSIGTGPDARRIQGYLLNGGEAGEFAYQAFRTLAFPAIVEHHLTAGATFSFAKHYGITICYMHAFEKSFSESGTLDGQPVSFGSKLAEDTFTLMAHFGF